MPKFAVYERQNRVVVYEVEAEDSYHATMLVSAMGADEFDYEDESIEVGIENVVEIED